MDTLEKSARSELMGRIKSKDTGPELALRRALSAIGPRPSREPESVPGRPDMAFKKAKVAVFVDGCFWHGCPLHSRRPKGESAPYWLGKIDANMARDRKVDAELLGKGWLPLRIWEHELKGPGAASEQAARVAEAVEGRL